MTEPTKITEQVTADPHHTIRLTFDGGTPTWELICNAPDLSLCHAVYGCGCELWVSEHLPANGIPQHFAVDSAPSDGPHKGRIDASKGCRMVEWFTVADGPWSLDGAGVEFDVAFLWEGDGPDYLLSNPRTATAVGAQ